MEKPHRGGIGAGPDQAGACSLGHSGLDHPGAGSCARRVSLGRDLYRGGMAEAQAQRRTLYPASASLAALTSEQRIQLLQAMEKTPFFEALRVHTITGFLAEPAWGGNRDKAGWKLIGFEDKWAWKPPFGYYDSPENTK